MSIYDNPYLRQMAQMPQFQQFTAPQNNGIQWVQGEEAAKSYYVQPGKSVLLMDSESKCFYIKSVDASGMPLPLRIFDYSERTQTAPASSTTNTTPNNDYITREEFERRISEISSSHRLKVERTEKNDE
jgi:hypothetical protein